MCLFLLTNTFNLNPRSSRHTHTHTQLISSVKCWRRASGLLSEDQLQCVQERLDYTLDRLPAIESKSSALAKWKEEVNTEPLAERP